MRNPAPIIATLCLALLVVFLLLRPKTPEPPTPPPIPEKIPTALSLLAENPDWTTLEAYQRTISRSDFDWAAAKRAIVHTAVSAIGVITELPKFKFDGARFKGTTVDACA